MTTRKVSFACGMALVAAGAITQEVKAAEGFYVGVHGGAVFLREGRFHDLSTSTSNGTTSITASLTDIKQKFDTGAGIGVHAGYGFANGFRVEGETTYRRNTLGDLAFKAKVTTTTSTGTTATATSVSLRADVDTDIHSWAFMVNGFYDFDLGMPFTPYIGAGIGPAIVTLHLFGEEDSDTVFAYQGIAGISYPITAATTMGVEYRYFATTGPNLTIKPFPIAKGLRYDSPYQSQNVFLTFSYHL